MLSKIDLKENASCEWAQPYLQLCQTCKQIGTVNILHEGKENNSYFMVWDMKGGRNQSLLKLFDNLRNRGLVNNLAKSGEGCVAEIRC